MYWPQVKIEQVDKAIIFFTLPEWQYFRKLFSEKRKIKWLNIDFSFLKEGALLIGPLLSAPQLALVLEFLVQRGIKSLFALGWAGKTPHSNLALGSLFLPTYAYSLEGTSKFYFKNKKIFTLNQYITSKIKEIFLLYSIPFSEGKILSVDVPTVVEKRLDEFNLYLREFSAMDMETSALYAIGEYYNLKVAAVHFITDVIGSSESKLPSEGMNRGREALLLFFKHFICKGYD